MLAVSLVTLGSPTQLTGGYLYHQRMAEAATDHGARLDFVSLPPLAFPLPALRGGRAMRRAQGTADVVVLDSIAAAFVAPSLARRPLPVPLVAVVHQPPGGIDHGPVRTRLQARLDAVAYRRAAVVGAASQALGDELERAGFEGKVRVVPPGRDLPEPPPGPAPDLRHGRRAGFLCVGNWVERKGILPLLEAFARLPADDATLHLVGRPDADPTYGARVRARLRAADLASRVVVHGPLPRAELARLYRAADAFVLASEREPYGTVYGEALAAGLPVVGWRAGNLPHLAVDGEEGVVLPVGDVDGLAAALHRLAVDERWRAGLAENARRRGTALPTWRDSADAFFALLSEVARPPGTAR